MSLKVYVGNLPFNMVRDSLLKLFEPFGEIEDAVVIADKYSGRSKGFGFVTFVKEEDAQKAIQTMNGKEVEGRELKVNEARPMEKR